MDRRDFLKTSGAALLLPAIPARREPAWVRELRAKIEAIPEDGWDRVGCMPGGMIRQVYLKVTLPGDADAGQLFHAIGCVNREGFAGRRAGTVFLASADRGRDGEHLGFRVRRGLRWDEWRDPATGRIIRIGCDARPLYEEFDFEAL